LNRDLEEHVREGSPDFELGTEACFDGETILSARLFFHRSKDSLTERYYFNRYEAHLQHPGKPEKDIKTIFYLDIGCRGVTFKQAFNLLQGRYVQRKVIDQNREKHDWWLFLEPKVIGSNGYPYLRHIKHHFDLEKALEKYPIRELNSPEAKERISRSLRRGNLQQVTFVHESGKAEPRLLYANPDRRVISNVALVTGTKQKKTNTFTITELPDLDHPGGDAISESILEEEPAPMLKGTSLI
jgi:hypothetical protein